MAVAFISIAAKAQDPAPTAAPPAPSATATPVATPTPISLASVTAQILPAEEERNKIDAELVAEKSLAAANSGPSTLGGMIDSSLAESAKILATGPSLDKVRDLETRWKNIEEVHSAAHRSLTDRVTRYEEQIKTLNDLVKKWTEQATQAKNDNGTPRELRERMETLIAAAQKTRGGIQKRRAEIVLLLPQAQKQAGQINDMMDRIKKARPQAVGRLFERESLPIWGEPLRLSAGIDLSQESSNAWGKQWTALSAYAQAQSATFLIHGFLFAVLVSLLYWARRRVRALVEDEPRLKRAAIVFEAPVAMAVAFSLVAANWIYPDAPRLLAAIGGAAALIPAIIILRRLVDRQLFPILNAMVVFYFIDQLRTAAAVLPIVARLLFVAEMAGGALLLALLLRSGRLAPASEEDQRLAKVTLFGARVALAVFFTAFLANSMGCVQLGNLLGNAALESAYLAVVLYAVSRIADGLIIGGLSTEPLSQLGMVIHHRTLIWQRTHRSFEVAAFLLWITGTLEMLSLRAPLFEQINVLLIVPHKDDTFGFTILGQFLAFGAVVWAAFLLSRFLRFVLEQDFYPRMHVDRGLSYAVSTMLHYTVLLLGFYMAASATGIDMTKFTILAGAFGVGMGFGLQNIINNFVSGIILLFERPIKVGDVVQMNEASGVVDRIGIRASIIRTGTGAEIIVPNGKLISDQVINWTLSNRQRGIEIPVSVASGIDPCRIMEILVRVAKAHPLISAKPAPAAQLTDLGTDTMQYKLSAWTDHIEQWGQIRSDLAVAINAEFVKEGIHRAVPVATPALNP